MSVCVFAVRRLLLCEELDRSSCGSVLFHGYLPPPGKDTELSESELKISQGASYEQMFYVKLPGQKIPGY